jgi:CO/xanthine dehydrogenase FAD-binding subunit
MTSLQELSQSELLGRAGLSARAEAAHATRPSWMLRNMSTVGGELVEHTRHCALAVALLALDAEVRLATTGGERRLALEEFGRAGPGAPAVLVEVVIPKPEARARTSFRRLAQLPSSEPIATAAVSLSCEGGRVVRARAALGSSVETARRLPLLEQALAALGPAAGDKDLSDACRAGLEGAAFAGRDGGADYLREMSAVLLKRTCAGLLTEENGR